MKSTLLRSSQILQIPNINLSAEETFAFSKILSCQLRFLRESQDLGRRPT